MAPWAPSTYVQTPPYRSYAPKAVYTVCYVAGAHLHQLQLLSFLHVLSIPLLALTSLSQIGTQGLFAVFFIGCNGGVVDRLFLNPLPYWHMACKYHHPGTVDSVA